MSEQSKLVNEGIVQIKSFEVESVSTDLDTSIIGTIFIREGEDATLQAQIVASIEIDPSDWGGIVLYIEDTWKVINIASSYPENNEGKLPSDYISTWHTVDERTEMNTMIEIGRDRSYIPTGGGIGTVLIDLAYEDKNIPDTCKIVVGVGSDEKNGTKVAAPDNITIEIPLT